jgi:hypothetical protein
MAAKRKGASGNIPKGKSNQDAASRSAAKKKPYGGIKEVPTGEGAPGSYQMKKGKK